MFKKKDELQGHILENELVSLHSNSFDNIEKFFSKFKSLVLQCRQCGIEQKDEHNVLSILSKLGPGYFVYVSMFHSKWEIFPDWKLPSLDSFFESLIKEKNKLIRMGVIQTSKDQALLVADSTEVQAKGRPKGKEPKENQNTSEGASGSKKRRSSKRKGVPIV